MCKLVKEGVKRSSKMTVFAVLPKSASPTFESVCEVSFIAKLRYMNLIDIALQKWNQELAVITVQYYYDK